MGLTFTGRDPAPRKWSPLTAAGLGRQHGTNHIYLFIRTTLERCLIAFSYWTDPLFANERLIGTDRAQDHERERVINREDGGGEEESSLQVKRRLEMEMHGQTGEKESLRDSSQKNLDEVTEVVNTVTLQLRICLCPNASHFPHFPSSPTLFPSFIHPSTYLAIPGRHGASRKSREKEARSGAYILKNHLPS